MNICFTILVNNQIQFSFNTMIEYENESIEIGIIYEISRRSSSSEESL